MRALDRAMPGWPLVSRLWRRRKRREPVPWLGSGVLLGGIAPIAYISGIDPVHFWMVTLVSFELGYLSPPVALNQLLARQVIGEAEFKAAAEDTKGLTFYQRHERILLPLMTMATVLIIVAFGPLIYQGV